MANLNDLIKNTDNLLKAIDSERNQALQNEENIKKSVNTAIAKLDEILEATREINRVLENTDDIFDEDTMLSIKKTIDAMQGGDNSTYHSSSLKEEVAIKAISIEEMGSNIIKFPR